MSGINHIFVRDFVEKAAGGQEKAFITLPFYFAGKEIDDAGWGMTLLSAGSMRFRWNEVNLLRSKMLDTIVKELFPYSCSGSCVGEKKACDCKRTFVPIELIHSKIVYDISDSSDTKNKTGDGMITKNHYLIPVVTVADCMPLFLYDKENGVFGAFHSGWKGTGIIGEGISLACKNYGSRPENICVAIGPHIGECCYKIDEERAEYFTENFGDACVKMAASPDERNPALKYQLSLTEANLFVLKKSGIPPENIVVSDDCTSCTTFRDNKNVFGSFRRQAAFLPPEVNPDERSKSMTVQAAFAFRN